MAETSLLSRHGKLLSEEANKAAQAMKLVTSSRPTVGAETSPGLAGAVSRAKGAADDALLLSMLQVETGGMPGTRSERRSRRAAADLNSDVTGPTSAAAWNALDDERREELVRQAREEYASIKKTHQPKDGASAASATDAPSRSRIQKERLSARTERSRREAAAARTEASRQIASVIGGPETGQGADGGDGGDQPSAPAPAPKPERKAPEAAVAAATRAAAELQRKVLAVEAAAAKIETAVAPKQAAAAPAQQPPPAAAAEPTNPDEQWPPPPMTLTPPKPIDAPKLPLGAPKPDESAIAALSLAPDRAEAARGDSGDAPRKAPSKARGEGDEGRAAEAAGGSPAAVAAPAAAEAKGKAKAEPAGSSSKPAPAPAGPEDATSPGGGTGHIAYKGRSYGPKPVTLAEQALSDNTGKAASGAAAPAKKPAAGASPAAEGSAGERRKDAAKEKGPAPGDAAAAEGGAQEARKAEPAPASAPPQRSAEGASTSGSAGGSRLPLDSSRPPSRLRGGGGAPPGFFLPCKLVGPPGWEKREIPNQKLPAAIQRVRELLENADREGGTQHSARLTDEQLVRFIRTSSTPSSDQTSFEQDTAEAALAATRYVVFVSENPTLCDKLDGEEFWDFFTSGAVRIVRQPDCKGRKVISIQLAKIPPGADGLRLSRCLLYIIDRLGRDVQFQVFGVIFLFHCAELSHLDAFQLITRIPFSIFTQFFYAWHNCLPMRWQRTYVFEEPSAVPGVWSVIGSCLTEQQRAKVRFHGRDYSALHAVIAREYLPPEYLGTCPEQPIQWLDEQLSLDYQSRGEDLHAAGEAGDEGGS